MPNQQQRRISLAVLEDQVVDEVPAEVVGEGEGWLAVLREVVQALVLDDGHGLLHGLGQFATSAR